MVTQAPVIESNIVHDGFATEDPNMEEQILEDDDGNITFVLIQFSCWFSIDQESPGYPETVGIIPIISRIDYWQTYNLQ